MYDQNFSGFNCVSWHFIPYMLTEREREKCMYIQDLVTPMKLEYDSVSYWSKKAKFLLNLSQKQKDKYYQEKNCNVHPI